MKNGDGDWIADLNEVLFEPDESALSRVESVQVDGSTVTGTATFVRRDNTTQEWVSMTGTFEATCGEERTSQFSTTNDSDAEAESTHAPGP